MDSNAVDVRRSPRRRRTLTVFREGGKLVALVPAQLTPRQERELLPPLVARFLAREANRSVPEHPDDLTLRAVQLHAQYLADRVDSPLPPIQVNWVGNQLKRWGSCTPDAGRIRISDRLKGMPDWVGDYVLLHEVVHLYEARHSPRFRDLLGSYPQAERARGYLEGYQAASGLALEDLD